MADWHGDARPAISDNVYSIDLWKHNQQLRKDKSFTPTSQDRPRREYLLTGIGRCWVCATYDGREANLRGVTGGPKGREYYRCATIHSNYKLRGKKAAEEFETVLPSVGLTAQPNGHNLLELHKVIAPQRFSTVHFLPGVNSARTMPRFLATNCTNSTNLLCLFRANS